MEMQIQKGEIAKLDGLEDGSPVSVRAEGKISWDGEVGTLSFDSFDVETENSADKSLKTMMGKKEMGREEMGGPVGGSF